MDYTFGWTKTLMKIECTLSDAIRTLNDSKLRIGLVVTEGRRLVGTVTDGDIRRGLLSGCTLADPISKILNFNAIVAREGIERSVIIRTMRENGILQIPVVDGERMVVGLYVWSDISPKIVRRENRLVIMAGGNGRRLRPLTENCPKPMLHVQGKPILEHIILKAKSEGFFNIVISIFYLGHMIEDYFRDGSNWGVNISYIRESSPMGTAGALGLIKQNPGESFVVTNGDVIAKIDYASLIDFHNRHEAVATMVVRQHEIQNPFGVVHLNGIKIIGFEEKPIINSTINAGIYALHPKALEIINKNICTDMPELFECLRKLGLSIIAFPIYEDWIDIGRKNDLERANKDWTFK